MKEKTKEQLLQEIESLHKQIAKLKQEDIAEAKQAQAALEDSEKRFKTLFEYAPDAYYLNDIKGTFIDGNIAAEKITGYKKAELIGKSFLKLKLLSPNQLTKAAAVLAKHALGKATTPEEFQLTRKDGTKVNVEIAAYPIKIKGKSQVLGIARDITARKAAEEKEKSLTADLKFLSESAMKFVELPHEEDIFKVIGQQLSYLVKNSYIIVSSFHPEDNTIEVKIVTGIKKRTKKILQLLGRDPIGMRLKLDTQSAKERIMKGKFVEVKGGLYELSFNKIPKKICTALEKAFGVKAIYSIGFVKENNLFGAAVIIPKESLDLSHKTAIEAFIYQSSVALHKWHAEKKVAASLKEKDILLREIHHRVKNNLQIISSLLRLQSRKIEDNSMQEIFQVSQQRIRSIALIHENLYLSDDLGQIDFSKYLRNLTSHLSSINAADAKGINFKISADNIFLDINRAIPCGLLLNELITNALKYAFPEETKGEIKIDLERHKKNKLRLSIADNGIGFPKGLDFRKTESLGLQLVNSLISQLNGTIKMQQKAGTKFTLVF
jgi:PAS domain S-box-containing protein